MLKSLTHVVHILADWLTHTSLNTISVEQCNATGREEGWMLVSSDGARHGQLQLRGTGAIPRLQDDVAAWRHVVGCARRGSRLHRAALRKICDGERWLIETHCAWIGSIC